MYLYISGGRDDEFYVGKLLSLQVLVADYVDGKYREHFTKCRLQLSLVSHACGVVLQQETIVKVIPENMDDRAGPRVTGPFLDLS